MVCNGLDGQNSRSYIQETPPPPSPRGNTITHMRAKQRSDKTFSKFVVPEEGGYAKRLSIYLTKVNKQLDKYAGRVFYTGTQHSMLKKQVMGKNTLAFVPREIAKFIGLQECDKYTFHSFRRTSATSEADAGSSTEQLVDFFGWKNGSMCQEYICSVLLSRPLMAPVALLKEHLVSLRHCTILSGLLTRSHLCSSRRLSAIISILVPEASCCRCQFHLCRYLVPSLWYSVGEEISPQFQPC